MKKLLALSLAILLISCCLASCGDEEIHFEHTYEYIVSETGHFKSFTCGCPAPDVWEEHYDHDSDWKCDACGYIMGHTGHTVTYISSGEFGHFINYTCGCLSPEGTVDHYDQNGDNKCDYCEYEMTERDEYSVTMNDEEWLYESLKPTYKAGETVTVKIKMAMDLGYIFLVNGEKITNERDVDGLYWEFTFTMPSEDVVIDFKTYDGFLPDYNYSRLIEAHWMKYPDAPWVSVRHYYGEFASGAIVAMVDAGGYAEYCWSETVAGYTFDYGDGNRITVLYEGEIYTLEEAYESGYLTNDDLKTICEWCY